MARKRNKENEGLPPNLYKRKGIYYYRDPRTKTEYSLGKNKSLAITESIQANLVIYQSKNSLIDRINNVKVVTLHDWLDDYMKILHKRDLKPKSIIDYSSRIKIIKSKFIDNDLKLITSKDIHDFISSYEKPTMAKLLRSVLSDAFNEAITSGILEKNPVTSTKAPKIVVQRARLSLEQFNLALTNCNQKYRNVFILSLLIGQRIGDIVKMKWDHIYDGKLHIEQAKTGVKIAIPIDLRLDAMQLSISDVLEGMRNGKEFICGIQADYLRKQFIKSLGDCDNKPIFDEIRRLSARLYEKEKGAEFASKLLGHKSMKMTSKYLDNRNNDYIEL